MARNPQSPRKRLALGLAAGTLIGSWTAWQTRKIQIEAAKPGMIDWDRVRSIAHSMNRGSTFTQQVRDHLDAEYRSLVDRTIPLVADYTGDELPVGSDRAFAFDRIDWIDANITAFQALFEPIERFGQSNPEKTGRAAIVWNGLNQTVLSAEIGFLLGYLARRVLGQYDLALLGREPMETSGKLYFVQPNIAGLERTLNVPSDQFRLWLALHETTHAFEFESHPWVREYMNSTLEEYFTLLTEDVEYMKRGVEALKMFYNRARRGRSDVGSWIEMVMSDEQRRLFARMQALMAVVEGYSNHVMNAVGKDLMPDYDTIRRRFEQRQLQRSPAEQMFARMTGLDLKLEQYRMGEAFIDEVVELRDHETARKVWTSPDTLPTLRELKRPDRWVRRIEAGLPPNEDFV